MRRRDFIAVLGGAAVWPVAAWAQQGERVRRVGVLTFGFETPNSRSVLSILRDDSSSAGAKGEVCS